MKKKLLSFILALCMVLTMLPTVALAEYTVTDGVATVGSLTDLQAALADKSVSEIILSEAIDLIDKTTLDGEGKTVRVATPGVDENGVVQTGSNYKVFTVPFRAAVSISNMTIIGGRQSAVVNEGTLTMKNVTVTRSGDADLGGGGIYNIGNLILKECSIIRNVARYGGGILNYGGTIVMDGCSLSENRSIRDYGGGAAENKYGEMYINNSVISNNTSAEIGGGINNNNNAALYLMNSTVTGNATTGGYSSDGGGIGNNGGTLYAVNSLITKNYRCTASEVQASDIGRGNNANHLHYCTYGALCGADLANDSTGNSTATDRIFAGYRSFGVLSGPGVSTTAAYSHPVLLKSEAGRLYAPLAASDSPAAEGGVYATYFDYSDLDNIKMSYKITETGAETVLGSCATGGTEVASYMEGGTRASGVIGASGTSSATYCTVTVNPAVNGTVSGGTVYGDTYAENTPVTLTATPKDTYYFNGWQSANGSTVSTENPYTFSVTKDVTLTPIFGTTQTHTVTLNTSTGITGFEVSTDGNTYAAYSDLYTIDENGSLYIKAIVSAGYTFTKWADGITDNPYQISGVTGDLSYTPTAAPTPVDATVSPATVRYDKHTAEAGIDFTLTPGTYTLSAVKNGETVLTLNTDYTVSANTYTIEQRYLNAQTVGDVTLTFDMNGGTDPTATVTVSDTTPRYALTVNQNGGNGGMAGGDYAQGARVTVNAGTRENYRFDGWTSSDGGTFDDADKASTTFTMPGNATTLTANWAYNGGGSYNPPVINYTLTFDTNGGSAIPTVTKTGGTVISLFDYTTTKDGYTFDGWCRDNGLTDKATTVTLNRNQTVYAKWMLNAENPNTGIDFLFNDITDKDWFYGDVAFVYAEKLMQGTGSTVFNPNITTTRGMIVMILYRLEGAPDVTGSCPFDDVTSGMYYEDAITWAAANKIVEGCGNEKFRPEDDITHEQMAAILWRYAKDKGYDITAMANLSKFSDESSISGYAVPAVSWANANELVTGKGNGILDPGGNACRCEVAAILHRFCKGFVK